MNDEKLYNSRIINTYVLLVKKKYPHVDINRMLQESGIEPYQVSDQGHWFSQRQVDVFHEKLVQATANPEIGREAGRFSASGMSLGHMRRYILGQIGPLHTFFAIKKSATNFTRSASYECRKISANKVEIVVTPNPGVEEKEFQCKNRKGFFESIVTVFDYDSPQLEHPECLFKGDAHCRYIVTWKQSRYLVLRKARNVAALAVAALLGAVAGFGDWHLLLHLAPVSLLAVLTLSYACTLLEKNEVSAARAHLKEHTDDLLDAAGRNYNNAQMVNEVGQAVSKQLDIDQILSTITSILQQRLDYDRGLLLLADQQKEKLECCAGFGYTDDQLELLNKSSFNLTNPNSKGLFVTCFRDQKPVLVNKMSDITPTLSASSAVFAAKIGGESLICCAIICEGESLGILAVDNLRSKRTLTQSDLSLITGISSVIGIAIRNAMYLQAERRLAEQLRQSQKMEAVGQLAGGVAHDFNNLLTAIIGFTTLAQMQVGEGHPSLPYLQQIILASDRATHLTKGLLSFSRTHVSNLQPTELCQIVRNMEKLLRRLISEEIELRIETSAERLPVIADAAQVDQVLLNLATNARDAMEAGGVLSIEARPTEVRGDADGMPDGRYALLSVTDTGCGMDEETKARVFEPFFTTKEVGKGTGLGLAIVYGNLKQHKGHVRIDSTPGSGTTFKVYLPLVEGEPAPQKKTEMNRDLRGNLETVLVVEDATEVRKLTREVLEKSGYLVIEAVDGVDALEKFNERADDVELVIMDVIMPRMSGKEAFGEMRKKKPALKALFTSGYTQEYVQRKGILFEKDHYLSKPSPPHQLLEKVRDLLVA